MVKKKPTPRTPTRRQSAAAKKKKPVLRRPTRRPTRRRRPLRDPLDDDELLVDEPDEPDEPDDPDDVPEDESPAPDPDDVDDDSDDADVAAPPDESAPPDASNPAAAPPRDARGPEERKADLIAALELSFGVAAFGCQRANVPYQEYWRLMKEDPDFAAAAKLNAERALDFVEGKALEEIRKGNARLIQFYLQTKGKARGYGREHETKEKPSKSPSPLSYLGEDEMEY